MIFVFRAAISRVLFWVGVCLCSLCVNLVTSYGLMVVLTTKVQSPDLLTVATVATISVNLLN